MRCAPAGPGGRAGGLLKSAGRRPDTRGVTGASSSTSRRLAAAFLFPVAGVVLAITLVPFDFRLTPVSRLTLDGSAADLVANLLLFFPLGFLHRLSYGARQERRADLLIKAGLFSLAIESAQVFLPGRFPSPLDVGANLTGAALGGLLHDRVVARIRQSPDLLGRLGLELPVMGVVYLLVPVLWLDSLAVAEGRGNPFAPPLLGLTGAAILGTVYRRRVGGLASGSVRQVMALAAGWFLIGTSPGLVTRPLPLLASAMGVALVGGLAALVSAPPGADRRYEVATLIRIAPAYTLYLVLLVIGPSRPVLGPWRGSLGLPAGSEGASPATALGLVEHSAAFALVGYLLAEARGRWEDPYRHAMPRLVGLAGVVALALEALAGLVEGPGGSGLRALLAAGTAGLGGAIYHVQRAEVHRLRDELEAGGRESAAPAADRRSSPPTSSVGLEASAPDRPAISRLGARRGTPQAQRGFGTT